MSAEGRSRLRWVLLVALAAGVIAGVSLLGLTREDLARLFAGAFWDSTAGRIFLQLRLPRVLMAFLAGVALSVSGMVFQAIFRNPLATPFTLGVSSGAALGAALAVKLGFVATLFGLSGVTLCSFAGAALTVLLIYLFSTMQRDYSTEAMLLAGVALSFLFSSVILFIQYISDFSGSYQVMRWLMGDLNTVGFQRPAILLGVVAPALLVVFFFARDLDLILAGEELAGTRGVHVERVKIVAFATVSLLTGVVVSFAGPIGFVGMMVPYLLRIWLGALHRPLLWACVLAGGAFLCVCDLVARSLIFPAEIPVGIITALLGSPFFIWLLVRGRSRRLFY